MKQTFFAALFGLLWVVSWNAAGDAAYQDCESLKYVGMNIALVKLGLEQPSPKFLDCVETARLDEERAQRDESYRTEAEPDHQFRNQQPDQSYVQTFANNSVILYSNLSTTKDTNRRRAISGDSILSWGDLSKKIETVKGYRTMTDSDQKK